MDCDPSKVHEFANDMKSFSEQTERFAATLRDKGDKQLRKEWQDEVGEKASSEFKTLAERADDLAVMGRTAVIVLNAFGDAIEVAQRSLRSYTEIARTKGLEVDAEGHVSLSQVSQKSLTAEQQDKVLYYRTEFQTLINDALKAVREADELCEKALGRVSVDPDSVSESDVEKAQTESVHDALELFRNQLPDGLSAEQQEAWWNSLTPEQRREFQKAVPVELAALPGISENVKDQMRRLDQGFDAVKTVDWVYKNWNNDDVDTMKNNCTNFVSSALNEGGGLTYMAPKEDVVAGFVMPKVSDGWIRTPAAEYRFGYPERYGTSPAWGAAQNNMDFFLKHGGTKLNPNEVLPGDIVYWEEKVPSGDKNQGAVQHAAVVTAVLPKGQILYGQQNSPGLNLDAEGRAAGIANHTGGKNLHYVRPKKIW
ncbi:amidase domain-containing protein [Austwickia chelonae]|uniref:amidase domain-containing protein n=1 Tax=Austwickia chelonae TaxID=100225 RepID=UPI0013C3544D|nr:amidase domain-containing protein [Austwickia chelonae]